MKDVDFGRREVTIREGKGGKDRITMLPLTLVLPLREQIAQSKLVYENDRLQQRTGVSPALGALAIGFAADRVGLPLAVEASSGGLIALLLLIALRARNLRDYRV